MLKGIERNEKCQRHFGAGAEAGIPRLTERRELLGRFGKSRIFVPSNARRSVHRIGRAFVFLSPPSRSSSLSFSP